MARPRSSSSIALPWERQGNRLRELLVSGRWRWIALALVVALAALAIRHSALERERERKTAHVIAEVERALSLFRQDMGRCPHAFSELVMPSRSGGRYLRALPTDGWGRPLWVRCPGRYDPNDVDVVSAGPSGNFLIDDNQE